MADLDALADETLVEYVADGLAVELFHAGEGGDGPFDACAEDDVPLLRFATWTRTETGWAEGCTGCTALTPDDDPVLLVAAARTIHRRLRAASAAGESAACACDRLVELAEADARRAVPVAV